MRDMATVPRVTYALIAINVIVFLAGGQLDPEQRGLRERRHRKERCSGAANLRCWPGRASPTASGGGWSRSGFLHENILHIGFNMWVLLLPRA